MGKQRIPGAPVIRAKGRPIAGHPIPTEVRTWQNTRRAEELDRVVRSNGRLEPRETTPLPDPPRNLRRGYTRR